MLADDSLRGQETTHSGCPCCQNVFGTCTPSQRKVRIVRAADADFSSKRGQPSARPK